MFITETWTEHLRWFFANMLGHCCPVPNAIHIDCLEEEQFLVRSPRWIIQRECKKVHDPIAVAVLVIP